MQKAPIIIVGGGPGGSACALKLADAGHRVVILDKAAFPRDKICGDALSPDVYNQLPKIRPSLLQRFEESAGKQFFKKMLMVAPNGVELEILVCDDRNKLRAYVMPRQEFDRILNEEVREHPLIELRENIRVQELRQQEEGVFIQTDKGDWLADFVVGADGAQSVVARQLAGYEIDRESHCGALRVYYENVAWPEGDDRIELHYFNEVVPGYLWIFPLSDNRANVGIGMMSQVIADKKINLKELLREQITNHPRLKERFKDARALETVKGFGIPVGMKKFRISGNRFVLIGDAASIVDPLTGEGVGNALRSGRFAAEHIVEALKQERTDAAFNKAYEKRLYKAIWSELSLGRYSVRFFKNPGRINFLFGFLSRNKWLWQGLVNLMVNQHLITYWNKPAWYGRQFRRVFGRPKTV